MNALQHGTDYDGEDVAGWFFSEKLNGCRAYWDGATLWSKSGRRIPAPTEFLRFLPDGIALDGELYAGVYGFQLTSLATRLGHFSPEVEFVAFDAPIATGDWPERMETARRTGVLTVTVGCVSDINEARCEMARVHERGGEGLMLRRPRQPYLPWRSNNLLKLNI